MSDPGQDRDDTAELTDPRHFRMIDLFAVMTLTALFLAMVAPFAREMRPEIRLRLVSMALFQLAVLAGSWGYAVNQRRNLLVQAGRRIGVGYGGGIRWRHWPAVKSSIYMLLFAAAQFALTLALATNAIENPNVLIQQAQLAWFTGLSIARFQWRAYPNTLEFFENGISQQGTMFIPWTRVELRPSHYFPDRIVVVIRPQDATGIADTKIAQVSDPLRKRLFSIASAAGRV